MPEEYLLTRDDRGWWAIGSDTSEPAAGGRSFPTQPQAIDSLKLILASKGLAVASIRREPMTVHVYTRPLSGPTLPDITLRLSASPELADLIQGLSSDLHLSSVETILQALIMLRIVVDGGKDGRRLAFTDDELNAVQEILIPGQRDDQA